MRYHYEVIIMEVRDRDIENSRCDNLECNQLLLGIAIVFNTPHGDMEICSHCVIRAKDMVFNEESRIINETKNDM